MIVDPSSLLLMTGLLDRQPGMRVGAARAMETVVPLGGAVLDEIGQLCSDSEVSDDGLLSVGALSPINGTAVCCARLDDFDWDVPNHVSDIFTSERDIELYLSDPTHDQRNLPDMFLVVSAGMAAVPRSLLVDAETVSPAVFREEAALVVAPLAEEVAFRVGMVGLVKAGSDLPGELLHSACVLPDCCFTDVGVLVPEMFPVVSARDAAVPMSLTVISEVFSSAVFAGGVVADAAPWLM